MTAEFAKPAVVAPLSPPPGKTGAEAALDAFLTYLAGKGLELYPAQERAILELFEGNHVILKTPTGSGKSLVAAALQYQTLCAGGQSVYTSPIKALVNEKFLSLCRDFGADHVGMSTGDATVNPGAPVLCCTAEVLANRALCEGPDAPINAVILDEFHYYAERERGVAWQIPLLALPQAQFLLMSATIGETAFFESELTRLTGRATVTVASTDRPVPLDFSYSEESLDEVVTALRDQGRLPAYLVHFTQRGAAETAQKLTSINFCTTEEKAALGEILAAQRWTSPFGRELRKYLRLGIGIHHAGLLPKYRILVERLAQENRLKIICGTDTLGVGVNVPIRSVVFTALSKYDGDKTRLLPVRDFHQIAGRAGRKGFDDEGFVVAQAPEHVIENRKLERKAAENPKKAKKLVRRKPPEKGYVHWDEASFRKLIDSAPEPLASSFDIHHGFVLNVLSREGDGCAALRKLIRDCHEPAAAKPRLRRRAWRLFRSLLDKDIVEILPEPDARGRKVRLHLDLQEDFSLNQVLSLYLVDTVERLDRDNPEYPSLVLSLVESVLENPDAILRKQVDRLKDELMRKMKAEGVPYEERLERLTQVEHPKPYREFIYNTFNEYAANHPWVGEANIQPKSIAREMFERYMSFADYVRAYGLERAEGLLLRHLSNTYKTLTQTVPDSAWDDEIEEMITYLEQLVRGTDSSLLDEWEMLRNPDYRPEESTTGTPARSERVRPLDPQRDAAAFERQARNALFQIIRPLASGDWETAAALLAELAGRPAEDAAPPPVVSRPEAEINDGRGTFPWHREALAAAVDPYFDDHTAIRLDPPARNRAHTRIFRDPLDEAWRIEQTLVDPDELNDWMLRFRWEPTAPENAALRLHLEFVGPATD
jgi:hypothetical protein